MVAELPGLLVMGSHNPYLQNREIGEIRVSSRIPLLTKISIIGRCGKLLLQDKEVGEIGNVHNGQYVHVTDNVI